ncbi:hypothetical protein M404DRAFT_1008334 [Pisolithus tinctorius Marx 270]|uniref:Uncharacterized protein n=1 Tax=Pisolithus tinctorius Marx 270 TaxID=870435 RepID=A0A0C3IBI9_PISTI|nr:hypothetical protein M404DRAFT_1008334 [Pisolithus tinctorius Marx 270]
MPNGRPQPSPGISPAHKFFYLTYSPSGSRIVGGNVEGELYVWDAPSGNLVLGPLKGHSEESTISHICFFSEEIFLTASTDATVRQWNSRTGELIGKAFTGHDEAVCETACLVDKKIVGSVARYGQLLTWHMDTLEIFREMRVIIGSNQAVAFSRDGTRLVATHRDAMRIYDVENCQQLVEVNLESRMIPLLLTVAFAPDSRSIYFSSGGAMVIWNIEKEDFEDEVFVGSDGIAMISRCSPDGKLVATSYDDGKTYVWSTASREVIKIFDDNGPFVFSSDGCYFTHLLRGTKLAINDVKKYLPLDPSSWMDQPATSQVVDAEKERLDAVSRSDFFHTEREDPDFIPEPPVRRLEKNPSSPSSDFKTRGTGLMSKLFRRHTRSRSAQESDQVSLEIVYTARDKRPLIVASRNDTRTQERSNVDTTLDRRDTTWTITSSSPSVADEGDAQAIEGEHHGCCYACCFKLC